MDLVQLLRDADRILVFTGAGVSTGSGIRDFRGPKGVWRERQPVYFQDFMNSEAARIEYWDQQARPGRRSGMRSRMPCTPRSRISSGRASSQWSSRRTSMGCTASGRTSAERLVELHGTNAAIECMSCHERSDLDSHMKSFSENGKPPLCGCGGYLKPATIPSTDVPFPRQNSPRPNREGAQPSPACEFFLG